MLASGCTKSNAVRLGEMTDQQRAELEQRVIDAGRQGFQYRYESIRVPDEEAARRARNSLLDRFVHFMSSHVVLDFLSEVTDNDLPEFADGQATSYSPGHFLTSHDDDVAGKGRSCGLCIRPRAYMAGGMGRTADVPRGRRKYRGSLCPCDGCATIVCRAKAA